MLVLLVGPKGSGKSHIGRLLESRLGIRFFHVEPHWLAYHAACKTSGVPVRIEAGIAQIHPLLETFLAQEQHVCVETTGASPEILSDLRSIGSRHGLFTARITAPLEVCLHRIHSRVPTHQIPMDEAGVERVYHLSTAADVPADVHLENHDLTDEQILRPFIDAGFSRIDNRFPNAR